VTMAGHTTLETQRAESDGTSFMDEKVDRILTGVHESRNWTLDDKALIISRILWDGTLL
jgi:hypothetical protein